MRVVALSLVVALHASLSLAASFPTSISRAPLNHSAVSEKVSVGVTYEEIERGIDLDDGPDAVLKADSASLYVGYDVLPWLTLFGSLGASEVDTEAGVNADARVKFSGGLSAYVWEADIVEPGYMSGRLTLKPTVEISRYSSDSDVGEISWIDATAALPFGYEKFDSYPPSTLGISASLAFYIGPAVSYVAGTVDSPLGDVDFDGDELFGMIGGLDIYLSRGVSLGVEFSVFDETSIGASLRFHL